MAGKKIKGPEGIAEGLSGTLGDITKQLSSLMENITKSLKDMLNNLFNKKEKAKEDVVNNSKLDLNKLMAELKLNNVENNNEIDEDEQKIIDKILIKNESFKTIYDWLENNFDKETKQIELDNILTKIDEETDGGEIEQEELDLILNKEIENKDKITKDKKFKTLILDIKKDENIEQKYLLSDFVKAYDDIKKDIQKGVKTKIDKDTILEKLKNNLS